MYYVYSTEGCYIGNKLQVRKMDSFKIKCFYMLAKLKNYTAAGTALHISQPAVSKNIATLEQELGIKLFHRNTHGTALTPAGEYMLNWFLATEEEFTFHLNRAKMLEQESNDIINIGILFGSMRPEITGALNHYRREFPNKRFMINTYPYDLNIENLLQGKSDIILSTDEGLSDNPQIYVEHLFDMKYYLVFSNTSYLATIPDISVSDFRNETFLISSRNDREEDRRRVATIFSRYGFVPNMLSCVLSIEMAFGMAEVGLGVICSDSSQIINYASNPHSQELLSFFELDTPLKYSAGWINNDDKRIHSIVSTLKEYLKPRLCTG